MEEWREKFTRKLLEMKDNDRKEDHFTILTNEDLASLLIEIENAKMAKHRTALQYRRLKRFDVLEVGGIKKLIKKTNTDNIRYFIPVEEIFDVIDNAHKLIGHGGRDRLKSETGKKYANVTLDMINLYLSMCEWCQLKRKKYRKGLVCKPIVHSELNSRCQVDLIDMQSQADRNFTFIMVYQDDFTKFTMLKALTSKRAEEVAYNIADIFSIIGAPCILHSDNGRAFVNSLITELKNLWPELKLVQGKPRQGSAERANYQDIENMLATWLKDNNTTQWSDGLRYVQFMKNRALHSGISPYKAMFGIEPRLGLATTHLAPELIAGLESEEDLDNILSDMERQTKRSQSEQLNGQQSSNSHPVVQGAAFVINSVKVEDSEELPNNHVCLFIKK